MARQPQPQPRADELPEEFALRRLVAKARLKMAKAALKAAALGTYAAADTGRRNSDWRSNNGSADLAIIPDSSILIGRQRQLARDSWVMRSIIRAFKRNVVGKGINVTPNAVDENGKPLDDLNRVALTEWVRWAKSKTCDVERRQTFPQKLRLAAAEKKTVGEHLWIWSYRYPTTGDGKPDRSRPCGLQIQGFEPEQFDLRILSYQGREVRGGVEVDEDGAPLAYHLYTRNPNDVLYRHAFFSERVPADRCFHYFESERVLQSRGVGDTTAVMQDIRDLERYKSAALTRALMEACIGLVIKSQMPATNPYGQTQATLLPAAGESVQTNSGLTQADFVPGMVANLQPGEDVQTVIPTAPGNGYDPFVNQTVQGIAAGAGMSKGQVTRQSDGNFSSARQDMLEDRKEWEPEDELIIDDLVKPAYELWFNFAALEGRFDDVKGFEMEAFLSERHRFVQADYIPPPQTWIDPEKEAQGYILLLKNRLITREEIVAMRGGRYYQQIQKIAVETKTTEDLGLTLPENDAERAAFRDLIKAILTNKLGTIDSIMANIMNFKSLAEKAGLDTADNDSVQPLLPVVSPPGQLATGDPVENKEGEIIGGGVEAPAAPPAAPAIPPAPGDPMPPVNGKANGKPANGNGKVAATNRLAILDGREIAPHDRNEGFPDAPFDQLADQSAGAADGHEPPTPAPPEVPDYRAATDPVISCATCSNANGDRCTKFNFVFKPANVCDVWIARTLTGNIGAPNTAKSFPPGPLDGQRDLESRFYPQADPASRP